LRTFRPYLNLVRYNHNYRRLWLSQVVSNFGDWFGLLAVYALVVDYSDSELVLGALIVVKMFSFAVFSPLAGYVSDRFDRRTLMIICDLFRAVVVLGFLFIGSPEWLWAAFVLTALQMMGSAVFEPAKSSSIPNVTSPDELVYANILSNLSWSVIFTMGMGIGGLATAWLGRDLVFLTNAVTYVLSAWFIWKAVIPHVRDAEQIASLANPFRGIKDGLIFLVNSPHILRPSLAKGSFSIMLGGLVYLLILLSEEVLLMGSIGVGLLYSSRGLGTAVGPIMIRRFFKDERNWIRATGFAMITAGTAYVIVGLTASLVVMLLFVFIAHCGSGANWVMSTVLIQKRAPDSFRGRIFSSEWLYLTVCESVSVVIAAVLLEFNILNINQTIVLFAFVLIVIGIAWLNTVAKREVIYQEESPGMDDCLIDS
jgi:MFS family permease